MRFMVIVKSNDEIEGGALPDERMLTEMGRYNEELVKAGVMLAGDGLQPSSKSARVVFGGGATRVVDGPFTETKELIAGYWIWECRSLDDAIAWAKRCPNPTGEDSVLEIRPVLSADDFGDAFTPELREAEERLRAQVTGD
jgi:hypothetical protein